MNARIRTQSVVALALGAALLAPALRAQDGASPALALNTGKVVLSGTSNIHDYSAETTEVRIVRAQLAPSVSASSGWSDLVKPGALEAFEIALPVASLRSSKDDLDKNMHKALKASEFQTITFKLGRIETTASGEPQAIGTLAVAGVEREVTLALTLQPADGSLVVKGRTDLLMPDFGIAPPKAMLGMLKTHPKVTVTFEVVLAIPAA
jgi:hypothetical protein